MRLRGAVLVLFVAAMLSGVATGSVGCSPTHVSQQICGTTTTVTDRSSNIVVAYYQDLSRCNFPTQPGDPEPGDNGNYVVASVRINWGDGSSSKGHARTGGGCAGSDHTNEVGHSEPITGVHKYKKGGRHRVTVTLSYLRGPGNTYMNCTTPCAALGSPAVSTIKQPAGEVTLSGGVLEHQCVDHACTELQVRPAAGVAISVVSKTDRTERVATTDGGGDYSIDVPKGRYVLSSRRGESFFPRSRSINARHDIGHLDFKVCRIPPASHDGKLGCKLVKVVGKVEDVRHSAYADAIVTGPGDFARVGKSGRFSLLVPRGETVIRASGELGRASHSVRLKATKRVTDIGTLRLDPVLEIPFAQSDQIVLLADGLPISQSGFSLDIERSEPVAGTSCRFRQTVPFANGEDPSGQRGPVRSANFPIKPNNGYSRFCSGSYTATLSGAGEPVQTAFAIP